MANQQSQPFPSRFTIGIVIAGFFVVTISIVVAILAAHGAFRSRGLNREELAASPIDEERAKVRLAGVNKQAESPPSPIMPAPALPAGPQFSDTDPMATLDWAISELRMAYPEPDDRSNGPAAQRRLEAFKDKLRKDIFDGVIRRQVRWPVYVDSVSQEGVYLKTVSKPIPVADLKIFVTNAGDPKLKPPKGSVSSYVLDILQSNVSVRRTPFLRVVVTSGF